MIVTKTWPDDSDQSFKEAALWEEKTLEEHLKALAAQEASTSPTETLRVLEWADSYLKFSRKTHSEGVFQAKKSCMTRFLKFLRCNVPVEAITKKIALEFLMEQEKARSGGGANNDRKDLGAAWSYGVEYLPNFPTNQPNPFYLVSKRPSRKKTRYVPPEADFWKVHDVAAGQDRVMLLTYLYTAARRTEIFNLKLSDLDFESHKIQLWTRKRENGNLEPDWIPMVPMLEQALKLWLTLRPLDTEHVFVCLDQTPYTREIYGKPFTERRWWMKRLCQKAGVREFGLHGIRHLTASVLYANGAEVAVIQQILRHQSPNTTAKYLKKLNLMDRARAAMEKTLVRAEVPETPPPSTGGKVVSIFEKKKALSGRRHAS